MFCHIKILEPKRKPFNTDYDVTGWILCIILHIREGALKNAQNKHHIQVNNVSRVCFLDKLKNSYTKLLIRFGAKIKNSIIRTILLKVMNLYGTVKIYVMVIVICGIRNNPHHTKKLFDL